MQSLIEAYEVSKRYMEQNQDNQNVTIIGTNYEDKLSFLNNLLQNENLALNGSPNIYLLENFWKVTSFRDRGFKKFNVILMKAFDEIRSDARLSVFLLSSAFCFSSTVIIQIMQNELEDDIFIENFAFFYLQSALTSLKHIEKLPKIALAIFADSNNEKNMMSPDKWVSMVDSFYDRVNIFISNYVELIDNEIGNTKARLKQNLNAHIDMNSFRDPIKDIKFPVSIVCIYNRINNAYFEIKKKNNNWDDNIMGAKSLWFRLKSRCKKAKQEIKKIKRFDPIELFGITNETTSNIQRILHNRKRVATSGYIIESIYTEIMNNSLIKFRKIEETKKIIKFFKKLAQSSKDFEKCFLKESKEVVNDIIIMKLKKKHEEIISKLFEKHKADNEIFYSVYDNFIYLSAVEFSNNFSLSPLLKNSLCYKILRNIMLLEDDSETVECGLEDIVKNINLYKCLVFYNEEFEKMLKLLLTNIIDFNKCIFELYKEIIQYTINNDYKYNAVLERQINHYSQLKYKSYIFKLASKIENYATVNEDYKEDIKALLRFLKRLHTTVLINCKRDYIFCDNKEMKLKMDMIKETLRSRTLSRALTPTATGLTFGLINALAPVNAIPGLSLSMLFIGAIATSALIVYPFLKKKDMKRVKYEYIAEENYKIVDVIVILQLENATEVNKEDVISEDKKKYNFSYTFSVNKDQIRSARFNAKFFVICVASNTSVEEIKIEKQLEVENNFNDSMIIPRVK